MQDLIIKEANNGYALVYEEKNEDGEIKDVITVAEGEDGEELLTKVLTEVAKHLGCEYNAFGKDNLRISFDKLGDEVDDTEVKGDIN
jgi:hypothetical protein